MGIRGAISSAAGKSAPRHFDQAQHHVRTTRDEKSSSNPKPAERVERAALERASHG